MINWREIKSQEQLHDFLNEFYLLSDDSQQEIQGEMETHLELQKAMEHEGWYGQVRPRQVEEPLTRRRPRKRRGR